MHPTAREASRSYLIVHDGGDEGLFISTLMRILKLATRVNGKVKRNWSVRPPTSTVPPGALQGPLTFRQSRDPRPRSQEMRSFALSLDGPIQGVAVNLPDGFVSQPAPRTNGDWETIIETLGHSQAFRHTGNWRSEVLQGFDLVLLATYVKSNPDSTGIQKITYLWDAYGRFQDPPRFYDESQITRAEQRLGLSRKVKATDALLHTNLSIYSVGTIIGLLIIPVALLISELRMC